MGFHGHGGLMGEPDSWSPELEGKIKVKETDLVSKGTLTNFFNPKPM